ncbi:MAG: hypothetical protein ACE5EM_10710 [Sphingomonadales bacterium]
MVEGIALVVFTALVVYVCYWSVKAEDADPLNKEKKRFELHPDGDSND